jgi:competence protein ComEA
MLRHIKKVLTLAMTLAALTLTWKTAAEAEPFADPGPPTEAEDTRININEADTDALVSLPGIGPARAEAIVAEREKRPFRRVEDIMRVPGIGRKTYLRIRASIRVR